MSRLDWHFVDYPKVDDETKSSDRVIVKLSSGLLAVGVWDGKEWDTDNKLNADVCCWAYTGKVPDTTKPMPRKR